MSSDRWPRPSGPRFGQLPGVTEVDVDVAAGQVRITAEPLAGDTALRAAVEEAGYEFGRLNPAPGHQRAAPAAGLVMCGADLKAPSG